MPPPLGEIGGGVVPGSRFCTQCGKPLVAGDGFCTACGARAPVAEKAITAEDIAIGLVIPHKVSGLAVAAGYVGLVSLFCLVPSPIAILLGILAIRDLRKHPGKQGYGRAIFAIVAGSLALLAGLVFILLPLLAR
jgi:predicted acyltransferase